MSIICIGARVLVITRLECVLENTPNLITRFTITHYCVFNNTLFCVKKHTLYNNTPKPC